MSKFDGVLSMSELGMCSRDLVATYLGHETAPETPAQQRLLKHATLHEAIFANYFTEETGIPLLDAGLCEECKVNRGIERYGFHVELKYGKIKLIGHIDRFAQMETAIQTEIKSLGRFGYDKFLKQNFKAYSTYEWQEACYMESTDTPGIYIVGNRDTGQLRRYCITRGDKTLKINGCDALQVNVTAADIQAKAEKVAHFIAHEELPLGDFEDGDEGCKWCKHDYLCIKKEVDKKVIVLSDRTLTPMVKDYIKGRDMASDGEAIKDAAKEEILNHFRKTVPKLEPFKIRCENFASISYGGKKTKRYLDDKKVRELLKDKADACYSESAPYDDLMIRKLKEKEE